MEIISKHTKPLHLKLIQKDTPPSHILHKKKNFTIKLSNNNLNVVSGPFEKNSIRKQNTLSQQPVTSEYVSKTESNVYLPKINNNVVFNILNPVDISFGEKGIACNPKTFHKRNTMMPYESTYDTSNNITNTEQNINPKSRQKKEYLKTKTYTQCIKKRKYIKSPSKKLIKFPNVKCSTHSIGEYINAYAVNSFQGYHNKNNFDKVSLILQISKPKEFKFTWPKCSYISLYSGYNNNHCSDFLRENLHHYIIKDEHFPTNPKEAILTGLKKAEQDYNNQSTELAGAYVLLSLVINDILYVGNLGKCKVVISTKGGSTYEELCANREDSKDYKSYLGESINNNNEDEGTILKPRMAVLSLTHSDTDFMIMGSQGLFEQISNRECCEIAWSIINSELYDNIHTLSGAIVDKLIKTAYQKGSKHSITCIFISFKPLKPINVLQSYESKPRLKLKLISC